MQVTNFPFPTAPDRGALAAAQDSLQALGALDAGGALTDLGRTMAVLPLHPRPSRMILQVPPQACSRATWSRGIAQFVPVLHGHIAEGDCAAVCL